MVRDGSHRGKHAHVRSSPPRSGLSPITSNLPSVLGLHFIHFLVRSSHYHCPPICDVLSNSRMTLHSRDMDQYILPTELWVVIFEFTTACAEEYEFGRMERSMVFWGRSPNTIDLWQDVLKTRRTLVTISRFFNQLTSRLLYQSFFAITPTQVSRFRWTLQTQPALGGYVNRLGLLPQLDPYVTNSYPHILGLCPNVLFCDAEVRHPDLRPSPSLRSLELTVTPNPYKETVDPEFLHLLARILQATPQLEHLGIYWLPYRVKTTDTQLFDAITLVSLHSLHLRVCSPKENYLSGFLQTTPLFFSLTLPRLDDLLLEITDIAGSVLDRIPSSWLQHIRQFSATHNSIVGSRLQPYQFALLRKFTLDFSFSGSSPNERLDPRIPFIQLEEIELFHCTTPINVRYHSGFDGLHSVFSLCADARATPKLRLLTADITELKETRRLDPTEVVRRRLKVLLSVVKLIPVRGIDPKGLDSSSLLPALHWLVEVSRVSWIRELERRRSGLTEDHNVLFSSY